MIGEFSFPARILFGPEARFQLPSELRGKRPLLVADRNVQASGTLEQIQDALSDGDVDFRVFTGVEPNAPEDVISAGVSRFRSGCDCLIAVGGGSVIDSAKAIRLMVHHSPPLEQYEQRRGGEALIRGEMPFLVAVPTTAGTGAEVSPAAYVALGQTKIRIQSPLLIPDLIIFDPELTLDLPMIVTASGGFDAIAHSVEGYCSPAYHPVCDAFAVEGIRRAARSLARVVHAPQDLEARTDLMLAGLLGGLALRKGLGLADALSAALTEVGGVHHGVGKGLVLPSVLRFNASAIAERTPAIAQACGVSGEGQAAVLGLADALEALAVQIGLPRRLHALGMHHGLLGPLVEQVLDADQLQTNPRPVTREDVIELLSGLW